MDMNSAFKWCVQLLQVWAKKLNMTYEEINIWIFCIIEPIVFVMMLVIIIRQYKRNKQLKKLVYTRTGTSG